MKHFDSQSTSLFIVNGVMLVLTTVVVGLRCMARFKTGDIRYLSDGLCMAAYAMSAAVVGVMFYYLNETAINGVFKPPPITDPTDLVHMKWFQEFYKMSYISQLLYSADYALVKFSILAFLWDIFGVSPKNKMVIKIVSAVGVAWAIAFTFLGAFRCKNPVDSWMTDNPLQLCIPIGQVYIPFEATNLLFDVVLLAIPIVAVKQLKLSKFKKYSVMGIFLLGASTCVASTVRLVELVRGMDKPIFFWSTMQLGLSIICACLPTLGPLFRHGDKVGSSSKGSGFGSLVGRPVPGQAFKMSEPENGNAGPWTDYRGGSMSWARRENPSPDSEYPLRPLAPSQILVREEVIVHKSV